MSTDESTGDANEDGKERSGKSEDEKTGRFSQVINTSAATVALLVALVSLVFSLLPNLKPSEPPEKLGGQITKVDVQQEVWMGDYEKDVSHSERDKSSADVRGMIVRARVELSGFKKRHYRMSADLRDSRNGRLHPYAVPDGTDVGLGDQDLQPSATTDAVTFQLWVRNPSHSGRYFIQLYLFDVGEDVAAGSTTGDPGPMLDYYKTAAFQFSDVHDQGYFLDAFEADGAYTVNGELQHGIYEFVPPFGARGCTWSKLSAGADPDRPESAQVIDAGQSRVKFRITLRDHDGILVLDGCGNGKLIQVSEG